MINENLLKQYYNRYGGYWEYPDLLDFCYLANPYFNRSGIIQEMQRLFPVLVAGYPAGMEVNSGLAGKSWGVKREYIVPGNGAAELIKVLLEDLEGKVGIVRPTFEEYPNRLTEDRLEVFMPNNPDFRYTEDELILYFKAHHVNSIVLVNPDNPTGNFIPLRGVFKLAGWCKEKNIRFILDESFVDFSEEFEHNSCIDNRLLEQFPNMCVIKSISKSYGVPGLRLGILCSSDVTLVERMKRKLSIWNINSFAEFFMQQIPDYRDDYRIACKNVISTRKELEKQLREIHFIHLIPSQANFFLLEVLPPYTSIELCSTLLKEYNILASACLSKKGLSENRYVRIGVRDRIDNEALVRALKELMRKS